VDDGLQARHVVGVSLSFGQLQHANEHRGHHLGVCDAVLRDAGEVFLGVEVFHDHGGATEAMYRHVEAQRCRVIQRRRREVLRIAVESEDELSQHQQARWCAEGFGLVHERNALRATGGTAGVQHVGALEPFRQWFARLGRHRSFVAVVVGGGSIQHVASEHLRCRRHHGLGLVGLVLGGNEYLGAAVVDDVRQLISGEST
jgi:hypothetical protein